MKIPIAVQLYTLREEIARDFPRTLEKVAEIGYTGVEFAGFGGIPASRMRAMLDQLGLKAAASHTDIGDLERKLDEVMEYNLQIGNRFLVCPGVHFKTKEDYLKGVELFHRIGEGCRAHGLQFCYHNHAFEFAVFDGEYGLDLIYQESDPNLVKAEIDTYWVEYAGLSAADYVRMYAGRCPLVHLKDMEAGDDKRFTEIGNGILDIRSIIVAAEAAGVEWLVVEQDTCRRPAMESIRISWSWLKNFS